MDRRKFLSIAATAAGALGIPAAAAAEPNAVPSPAQGGPRYNVLLLMSDQHKRSCMGVSGDAIAVTPNLDALARESVRFTSAYCSNPVCGPSRASIMTGLHTHNIETRNNSIPFSHKHKTIADQFSAAGYLTALVGKMHFVDAQTHGFQYKLEFNDWLQYLGPKAKLYAEELSFPNAGAGLPEIESLWQKDPWQGHREHDSREGHVHVGRPSLMDEADHFDNFVARESIHFLENYARTDEPFLLVTSFLKPHDPFMPAKRFADKFSADKMKLPDTWGKVDTAHAPKEVAEAIENCRWTPELKGAAASRERMASYYGNLAQMDDCAGQVLSALRRLGLDRNTIIVYTSDHGEMLGDLGLWNKFQFYEGSCGVPLTVLIPGAAPAQVETPVSLVSLTATLADLCHVPIAGPSDGQSFAGFVRHPEIPANHGPVFAEFDLGERTAKYMIRDGRYKYTFWVHDIDELYDLQADPEEMHNLAAMSEHRATVEQLKQKLLAWHRPAELSA